MAPSRPALACTCVHLTVRLIVRSACILVGTSWQRQAIKTAQSVLQLRYGLLTEAQMKNALKTALQNNSSKYEKNMVYD